MRVQRDPLFLALSSFQTVERAGTIFLRGVCCFLISRISIAAEAFLFLKS